MKYLLTACLLGVALLSVRAQDAMPFRDVSLPVSVRVQDLISRMTPEEKTAQLMYDAPAIPRLGVPAYNWWNECLHGVARAGHATVFPQAITLASSWNTGLIHEVANAISDEARARYHEYQRRSERGIYQGLTFWTPNINILRDPRWGRGQETYGEDPFLTAEMGKAFVRGIQGTHPVYLKAVATAKHFAVHSGPEQLRHSFDAVVSKRDLHETYLPAFRALVTEGGVASVMCAYNRFMGEPACASPLLYDILRKQWNFSGYMVSDCWAISDFWQFHRIADDNMKAAAMALSAGCDLECGTSFRELPKALIGGMVSTAEIDTALARIFTARFRLGMFDPDSLVPYASISSIVNNHPSHNQLAREAARQGIVLLRNEKGLLPLTTSPKKIAVIGPAADDVQPLWGNYNGTPSDPVTILQGIRNKAEPLSEITHAIGCDYAPGYPVYEILPSAFLSTAGGKQGLTAYYYANADLSGDPLFVQTDDRIDFDWDMATPDPRLKPGSYSIRWEGFIEVPESGIRQFSAQYSPVFTYSIEDPGAPGSILKDPVQLDLRKETKYRISAEYRNTYGNGNVRLLCAFRDDNMTGKALEIASRADIVILVMGLNERLEGEAMNIALEGYDGGERSSLELPRPQRELIEAVSKTGKPVILILLNGGAVAPGDEASSIQALLTAGYPGQQGGNAVADVLFGDYNPAGRLPATWYRSVRQLPDYTDYAMEGRTYRYFREEPLYPFGYGLSYTSFEYSNLQHPEKIIAGEDLIVSVEVTNTGEHDGDEVVQIYITDEKASTPRPVRSLCGFERVHLKQGERKRIDFTITARQLSMINDKDLRVIEPGWFTLSAGGGQPAEGKYNAGESPQVLTGRFKVRGSLQLTD